MGIMLTYVCMHQCMFKENINVSISIKYEMLVQVHIQLRLYYYYQTLLKEILRILQLKSLI